MDIQPVQAAGAQGAPLAKHQQAPAGIIPQVLQGGVDGVGAAAEVQGVGVVNLGGVLELLGRLVCVWGGGVS